MDDTRISPGAAAAWMREAMCTATNAVVVVVARSGRPSARTSSRKRVALSSPTTDVPTRWGLSAVHQVAMSQNAPSASPETSAPRGQNYSLAGMDISPRPRMVAKPCSRSWISVNAEAGKLRAHGSGVS